MNKSEIAERAARECMVAAGIRATAEPGKVFMQATCDKFQKIVERAIAESHHDLTWQEKWDAYQALVKRRPALRDAWESFYAGASLDDDPVEAMERSIGLDPPKGNKKVELGDGEPSPPPKWERQESCSECDGDGCAKCESGAVQEVSPPSPVEILKSHWLMEIVCDHSAKTDQPLCACGWRGPVCSNVGDAVTSWANHAAELIRGDTRELKAALAELYEAASNEQYVDQLSIALEKAEKLL